LRALESKMQSGTTGGAERGFRPEFDTCA